MTDADLNAAWTAWLRTFRYDWWATPAFGHPTSAAAMLRAVTAWLQPFPKAYAVVGVQRGPLGNRLHLHGLLGGIGRHPDTERMLRDAWRHGNLSIVGFSPRRGALDYIVHQATEIEIIGQPVIYRPRR